MYRPLGILTVDMRETTVPPVRMMDESMLREVCLAVEIDSRVFLLKVRRGVEEALA